MVVPLARSLHFSRGSDCVFGSIERRRPMRHLVLLSVVGLVALVGGAYAFAGGSSGGMTAFALVDPNGGCPTSSPQCGSPPLVAAHTPRFVRVNVGPFGPRGYCLT